MQIHARCLVPFLLAAFSSLSSAQLAPNVRYRLVPVEPLAGAWSSRARAISGERFVGESNGIPSEHGYDLPIFWNVPSDPHVLGGIGVSVSFANDLNSQGLVVGYADFLAGVGDEWAVAFTWRDGIYRALPDLSNTGFPFSIPNAVNERGDVVGASTAASGRRAVLWWNEVIFDLGTLGGLESEAHDLDEAGRIVGSADLPDGRSVAALWLPRTDGGPLHVSLPEHRALAIVDLGGPFAVANGINEGGQVVGGASVVQFGDLRPFLWQAGTTTELASFSLPAKANAINDAGTIVGTSGGRAALWRPRDLALIDLNEVTSGLDGWFLREAHDVDGSGRIAGRASDASGTLRAFVLVPL